MKQAGEPKLTPEPVPCQAHAMGHQAAAEEVACMPQDYRLTFISIFSWC